MTRISVALVCVLSACAGSSEPIETGSTSQAVWTNGDFEGDPIGTSPPTGWTLTTYLNPGITDARPGPQTLASLNLGAGGVATTQVVGGAAESQTDPDVGATGTLRYPKYGSRAAVVNTGTAGANRNANSIMQTMTVGIGDVDPTDDKVHVRFAVAPVLENPTHGYTAQPYYFVRLQNLTRGTTLYQDFNASGQAGVPWKNFTDPAGQAAQYTDWQLVDISPGNASLAVGDQVELLVVAAGCNAGGHWGRVYVDAVGSGIPGLYSWATGAQQANAGADLTYTVNYKNGGTTTTSASMLDLVTPPNTVYKSTTGASCTAPSVGMTGTVTCTLGSLSPGATGSYTVTVTIPGATPTGTLITNGNYSIYASGVSALVGPKVNTTVTSGAQFANIGATITDGVAAIGWGQADTYTLVVTNLGPLATNATVTDTKPAQLTGVTWTCAAAGGGTCTASGSNNIADAVSLPVGATLTYTIHATIIAGSGSSSVVNTATVATSGAIVDPDTTDNAAVDTDTIGTLRTLTVTKLGATTAGSVTSTPAAIACGASCSADFLDASQVVLTAAPITGATFVGWGGACSGTSTTCTVTMAGAQTATASFAGAPAITSVASGSPQQTAVSTAFTSQLRVLVTDGAGNPVPGATVAFTKPGSGASATLSAPTAITDNAGIAFVTATANATPGPYSVTGSIAGVTPVATFSLSNLGAPAAIAVSSGSNQTRTVGTAFAPLVAIVTDAAGQVVPGATVTFAKPASGASATLGVPATSITDATGLAAMSATAGTIAGGYVVTASVASVSTSFTLTNSAGAATALVAQAGSGQSAQVDATFGTSLVAKVIDTYGNPVAGIPVAFTPPSSGASATLTPAGGTSTSTGLVTTVAKAGTVTGAYSVVASATGLPMIGFALTNTAGAPAAIAVKTGTPQSATVHTGFATPLSAVVTDSHGNFVPNAAVAFTAPGIGASATVVSATTDPSGVASTGAIANDIAGSYVASATIAAGSVGFALTNTAGAPATVTITAGGGQTATVGATFATAIQVSVADVYGNSVPGATVTLAGPGSGASLATTPITITTGATGIASGTVVANHTAGTYSVTATVNAITSAPISLTNSAGTATAIAVVSGSNQHVAVDAGFASLVVAVTDTYGNAVQGAAVSFTPPSSGATATIATPSTTTLATGRASTGATAGAITGSYTVTAAITGASTTFALANDPGAPATVAVVSGSGQSAVVATPFSALVAHVTDVHGNDVPSVVVTYTAPSSGARATIAAPGTATTGATGRATLGATAGQITGTYNVIASATGATPASFALTNTAGTVSTLTATGGGGQSAIVLAPFASPLAVHAADQYGNPVPSAAIAFTASGATFADGGSETTDPGGNAQIAATAGTLAGAYSATASSNGATATFALANLPGAAAAIAVVDGNPQETVVATGFTAPLHVLVTDAQGNPVPGATVQFAPAGTAATATVTATSAITGADGTASTTASANTIAGAHALVASIPAGASTVFNLTNLADTPASITAAASASPQQMTVGALFAAPLAVTVRDRFGNPAPNAKVSYAVPAVQPSASLSAQSATTDATGGAWVLATAGVHTGAYVAYASVEGVADAAPFSLANTAGEPATLVVNGGDPQGAVVDTDFATALAVLVLDANDNPVPNIVVSFAAPLAPATATLAASSAQTDASGVATLGAHASTFAGTYVVTASLVGSTAPVGFSLTNLPGMPATLTASSSSTPQNAQVDHAFVKPLSARVADSFGNNVPGVVVTFAAPATGATTFLSAPTAVSGSDGRANVLATAGTIAGAYAVTATASGVAAPASFALANLPGEAQTITIAGGDAQAATVATAFAQPLVALVQDSHGNPVPDALVELVAPDHGATATLANDAVMTGADGTAQTAVTAATVAGELEIIATTPSGASPVVFVLTATPGSAAAATALASASPQSAQVLTAFAQPLALTVVDAYGNHVPGVQVGFAAQALPGAKLSADHATTGSDGTASVLAQADETSGTYLVTATIAGTPDVMFQLTNTAATPSSVVITSGGAQHTLATTAFAEPVAVRVLDSFGNPVPGVTITMTVPADGATATMSTSSMITDADGGASVTLTASAVVGSFVLAAHTDGAFTPGTTTLQIRAIPTTTTATADAESAVDQIAHVAIAVKAELGTPVGTVVLVDADGTQVGSATLEDGTATLDVPSLAIGTHTLTARFTAQGSYDTSESTAVTFTVTGDTGSLSGGGCSAGGGTGGLVVVLAALFALLPRRRAVLGVVTVLAAHAGLARAEPDGARALDRFHAASPDSAWFALDSASFTGHREVMLSFVTDYAKHPLDIYDADGTVRDHVVTDAFIIQVGGSVTLYDQLRLSATVPMAAWQDGNGGTYNGMPLASPVFAFGDVSVAGDVRVLGRSDSALRVATGLRFALPTGSTTNFTSDGVFGVEPRVLAAGSRGVFEYAGEASALLRGESSMAGAQFGSELRYSVAAGMRFDRVLVGPELVGAVPLVAHTDVGTPLELQLGAHYTASSHLRIGAGGAIGVINAIGEPRWRMLAALTWTP